MKQWKAQLKGGRPRDVNARRQFNRVKRGMENANGFMTRCWGPPLWFSWHIMSLNYKPERKDQYIEFLRGLMGTLPCKSCRDNLPKNLREVGYDVDDHAANRVYESRAKYAKFVFDVHNAVNSMLGKELAEFGPTMDYYEQFRAATCDDMEREGCRSPYKTIVTIE